MLTLDPECSPWWDRHRISPKGAFLLADRAFPGAPRPSRTTLRYLWNGLAEPPPSQPGGQATAFCGGICFPDLADRDHGVPTRRGGCCSNFENEVCLPWSGLSFRVRWKFVRFWVRITGSPGVGTPGPENPVHSNPIQTASNHNRPGIGMLLQSAFRLRPGPLSSHPPSTLLEPLFLSRVL